MSDSHGRPPQPDWHRAQYSRWMLGVGAGAAVGLIVVAGLLPQQRTWALLLLIAAAAFLVTGGIKVTVSSEAVTVASALLPFVRRRIATARIQEASAHWTRAVEIGGWGYRWKPGMRAVSLRTGDALWLRLTNGRQFVVTVDDAQTAARLVNDHLPPQAVRD